jgi:hypothetical protein
MLGARRTEKETCVTFFSQKKKGKVGRSENRSLDLMALGD